MAFLSFFFIPNHIHNRYLLKVKNFYYKITKMEVLQTLIFNSITNV